MSPRSDRKRSVRLAKIGGLCLLGVLIAYNTVDIFSNHIKRNPGGGVSADQPVNVTQLQAGDCFHVVSKGADGTISTVVLTPCAKANDGEVYATPLLAVQPGVTAEQAARTACDRSRPASVPKADVVGFIYPLDGDYAAGNTRASCLSNG